MNNELHLYVAPSQIPAEEWAKAYAETVMLAQAAHFYDIGYGEEEDQEYAYAVPVQHKPWCHGEFGEFDGWESYGDATCSCKPSKMFGLSDDLAAYNALPPVESANKGGNGLKGLLALGVPIVDIWAGKATDQPSIRLPLLGIAATICGRFPGASALGNVGKEEYQCAQKWAKDVLEGLQNSEDSRFATVDSADIGSLLSDGNGASNIVETGWVELAATVDDGQLKYPVSEEKVIQLLIHVLRRNSPTLYSQFNDLTRKQKVQEIVRYTLCKPLFPLNVWKYLFENLSNPEVMTRYIALMHLRIDNDVNKNFVRLMFWSPSAFESYWNLCHEATSETV